MSDFSKLKVKKNGKEYFLNACTQDTDQNITGTKNFSKITVNSKNAVTSINGVQADTNGNVTIQVGSYIPDYSARIDISANFKSSGSKQYTTPQNGLILVVYRGSGELDCVLMTAQGKTNKDISYVLVGTDGEVGVDDTHLAIVPKGMTVYLSASYSTMTDNGGVFFIPFK